MLTAMRDIGGRAVASTALVLAALLLLLVLTTGRGLSPSDLRLPDLGQLRDWAGAGIVDRLPGQGAETPAPQAPPVPSGTQRVAVANTGAVSSVPSSSGAALVEAAGVVTTPSVPTTVGGLTRQVSTDEPSQRDTSPQAAKTKTKTNPADSKTKSDNEKVEQPAKKVSGAASKQVSSAAPSASGKAVKATKAHKSRVGIKSAKTHRVKQAASGSHQVRAQAQPHRRPGVVQKHAAKPAGKKSR